MTYWSAMYALVVQQGFLQGHFLCSDLLPCHILSAAGQSVRQCSFIYSSFHNNVYCFTHQPCCRLPWCPQVGSPPPSSPAASSKSPPGCSPPAALAFSPVRASSPAASRSFWAACCCADESEVASPLQTSSACVLRREMRKKNNIYGWMDGQMNRLVAVVSPRTFQFFTEFGQFIYPSQHLWICSFITMWGLEKETRGGKYSLLKMKEAELQMSSWVCKEHRLVLII